MQAVAHVHTCYPDKFGIPRQSGLVPSACARLVFEPPFRNADAIRGLEGFSHIWLIWQFSENVDAGWHFTVRPPRLGGNTRVGVFATRSPFRPNPIGLSVVKLERIELHPTEGPVLHLSGIDMLDGTPILDIKPYVPTADCIPQASAGFTSVPFSVLSVHIPDDLMKKIPNSSRQLVIETLSQDPRPQYQSDPARVYGLVIEKLEIKFQVNDGTLRVVAVDQL
ncbi:MAG: tRNA (N6-threonylcarbamoyladenosine(37)-N6)-methyltransferase TrmO [Akkermansia sp.]|nr:tRNA (N6-threonylcarbamoyladenosine(37)-N6)-methyltransferase TrmO [Akkermansia sp.]